MRGKVKLVEIDKLRAHEKVSPERLVEVVKSVQDLGKVKKPVIVDKETLVILDGHHRVEASEKLGLEKVPVILVDYMDTRVRVSLRRKELIETCVKMAVIKMGLSDKVFPEKTTKHIID